MNRAVTAAAVIAVALSLSFPLAPPSARAEKRARYYFPGGQVYGVLPFPGRLTNLDARPYTLELACGDLRWRSMVAEGELVSLAPPQSSGCALRLVDGREDKASDALEGVPLGGGFVELVIEHGRLRESVRRLTWEPHVATYGWTKEWPAGVVRQWAVGAHASSEYAKEQWSAGQAIGAPNTMGCQDSGSAWTTVESRTDTPHWIELRYGQKVRALGARLHVNLAPGAVREIRARTGSGWETVWSGPDPTESCPAVLAARFAEEVDTDTIRIVLDLSRQQTWFELDAVELLGMPLK